MLKFKQNIDLKGFVNCQIEKITQVVHCVSVSQNRMSKQTSNRPPSLPNHENKYKKKPLQNCNGFKSKILVTFNYQNKYETLQIYIIFATERSIN